MTNDEGRAGTQVRFAGGAARVGGRATEAHHWAEVPLERVAEAHGAVEAPTKVGKTLLLS